MRNTFLIVAWLLLGASLGTTAPAGQSDHAWRSIPLVKDGKVSDDWALTGWGRFVVDGDTIRTEPDGRGLGLLVYTKEKLGNCQIRLVFKGKTPRSNSGFYIRIDDGILNWTNKHSTPVEREPDGKLSAAMQEKLKGVAEAEEGPWYAVHHGYEVQIMDAAGSHGTGSIYSLAEASPVVKSKPGEWRTMVVTLSGTRVTVELDGKQVSHFDSETKDPRAKRVWTEPKLESKRPQVGYVGLQTHDPEDIVTFKEVSVRPLPASP